MNDPVDRFVSGLEELAEADLSALRRARGKPLGSDLSVYDIFNDVWRPIRAKFPLPKSACYMVATLYPWHPRQNGHGNLAESLRSAALRSSGQVEERDKVRFLLLVSSQGPALHARLAEALGFLAKQVVAIDWRRLLTDLAAWYEPGRPTQRAWMKIYFDHD